MPDPELPKLNEHGQEIWFKEADGESGYWPVHRKGWNAFLLACAWLMFSGIVGMVMIALSMFTSVPILVVLIALILPFVLAAPVLWRLVKIVRRHS